MATKKENRQPVRGTSLEQRVNASGGIKAGSHPEMMQPTPLDRAVAAVKKGAALVRGYFKQKQKKGGKK